MTTNILALQKLPEISALGFTDVIGIGDGENCTICSHTCAVTRAD